MVKALQQGILVVYGVKPGHFYESVLLANAHLFASERIGNDKCTLLDLTYE
jgi:hypothetical protein